MKRVRASRIRLVFLFVGCVLSGCNGGGGNNGGGGGNNTVGGNNGGGGTFTPQFA